MTTPNYDINYDDERLTGVKDDEKAALSDLENTYGGMIDQSDKYYGDLIQQSKDWADTQTKLQNERTDFAIEQIEQQKDQAKKDYTKEQSGAYVDWQKQSNQYGANAEQMAAMGMQKTGYSESSQVSMYNTYQSRVTAARESYNQAVLNYNNAIKDARLQNNSVLAEIAYEALQKQLELSLQGFQYKNTLIIEKADKKLAIESEFYKRYQDVIDQINEENKLKESVRQFEANYALNEREVKLAEDKFAYEKQQDAEAKAAANASKGKIYSYTKHETGNKTQAINKDDESNSNVDAKAYLNAFIKSGATKDQVFNEIAMALRNGALTNSEAAELRKIFTPKGLQY